MAFQLGHQPFPAFGLELKRQVFLGLQTVRLQTQTGTTPSVLLGPAGQLQLSGLVSLPNHVIQFFAIIAQSLFLYLYAHPVGSISLEDTDDCTASEVMFFSELILVDNRSFGHLFFRLN